MIKAIAVAAVQTALADTFSLPASMSAATPNLRTLLLSGDFFLGGVIAGRPAHQGLAYPLRHCKELECNSQALPVLFSYKIQSLASCPS